MKIEQGYKVIIWLTFICSFTCLAILIAMKYPAPQYTYRTELVILNNTNFFRHDTYVEDYLCDDDVEVSVYHLVEDVIYLSTWADSESKDHYGQCMLKIREIKK